MPHDRRHVDHRAAATLLQHLLDGELVAQEHAGQVDVQHPLPLVQAGLLDGAPGLTDAGVGNHDVQPAEAFHGGGDQVGDIFLTRHIDLDEQGLLAALVEFTG
ncbi:hypothetical protein D9M71_714260 [compost metagenome]